MNDTITVTGLLRTETDKAILLRVPVDIGTPGHESNIWIPRSHISYLKKTPTSEAKLSFAVTIQLTAWFAAKNSIIADDMLPKDYWKKPEVQEPTPEKPRPAGVGMMTTVLATQLVEAYAKDEDPAEGGFDISAGMFGTHVSAWVKDVADQLATSQEALRIAREWMGARPYDISAARVIDAIDAALKPSTPG